MSLNAQIKEAIQQLADTHLVDTVHAIACTVESVDLDEFTCEVVGIGGNADTTIPNVRLSAENNDGFVVIPKVDSTVIVVTTKRGVAYVALFSDVEKIQFLDGSYDGLVKVAELTTKLNNLENLVNSLITKYNTHIHVATDSITAAPVTVAPTVTLETGTLTPTIQANIENTLITHGQ